MYNITTTIVQATNSNSCDELSSRCMHVMYFGYSLFSFSLLVVIFVTLSTVVDPRCQSFSIPLSHICITVVIVSFRLVLFSLFM